jgi:hypothetical protein
MYSGIGVVGGGGVVQGWRNKEFHAGHVKMSGP